MYAMWKCPITMTLCEVLIPHKASVKWWTLQSKKGWNVLHYVIYCKNKSEHFLKELRVLLSVIQKRGAQKCEEIMQVLLSQKDKYNRAPLEYTTKKYISHHSVRRKITAWLSPYTYAR